MQTARMQRICTETSFTGSASISRILASHQDKRAGKFVTFFSRIPLLARVLSILGVPVVILLILSGTLLVEVRRDYSERDYIGSVYRVLNATSVLVDVLQVERGQSSLFVSAGCPPVSNCSATTLVTLTWARVNVDNATSFFSSVLKREREVEEEILADKAFSSYIRQVQGSLPTTRSQVNLRSFSSVAVMELYSSFITGLIDSLLIFQRLSTSKEFAVSVGQYVDTLRVKERAAFCRGMGSAMWGAGPSVTPSVLNQFTANAIEVDVFSKILRASSGSIAVLDALEFALSTEAAASSRKNFRLIIANDSDAMLREGTSNAYFANVTRFVNDLNTVVSAQGQVVRDTSQLTVKNSSVVLVGSTLSVTIITCTFLTFLLILSIRSANRSLAKSLLRAKSMDVHLRRFVPSRFMSLLDITEPTKLIPGLRAEITLTMLFADVRGFTKCAEVMDPNEMFETLLQYTQIVSPVISSRNGFIDRWVGDGVFCVFQDPEEAVFAALELHSAVRVLNERLRLTNSTTPVFSERNFLVAASNTSSREGMTGHTVPHDSEQSVPLLTASPIAHPSSGRSRIPGTTVATSHQRGDSSPNAIHRASNQSTTDINKLPHPFEVHDTKSQQPLTPGSTRTQTIASLFLSPPRPVSETPRVLTAANFEYKIGIGIHHGTSVCGVLGDSERVDGTLIGDAVNVAARLEGLCGKLGADTLISDSVKIKITSSQVLSHMRSLGPLKLAGREEKIVVWEVFDSNPEPIRSLKRKTSAVFESGMQFAANGDTSHAMNLLSDAHIHSKEIIEDEVLKRTLKGLEKSDLTDKVV